MNTIRMWMVGTWLLVLAACGGGGSSDPISAITSASSISISGTVSGAITSGVTITLANQDPDNPKTYTTTTNASGAYSFTGLPVIANRAYLVGASLNGYAFDPFAIAIIELGPTLSANGSAIGTFRDGSTNNNFVATVSTATTHGISGTISGVTKANVSVALSGTSSATTTTDATGAYTFTGLANGAYTIVPSLAGNTFAPASINVTLNGANAVAQVITSTVSSGSSSSSASSVSSSSSSSSSSVSNSSSSSSSISSSSSSSSSSSASTLTVLHSFGASGDVAIPSGAALIQGNDGNFYGTARNDTTSHGAIFKITPAGVETVLYSFAGGTDGDVLLGAIVQGSDGNFYGTTYIGGANNAGTVFRLTPAGAKTALYSFGSAGDGNAPTAALIQGSDGNFYGTTRYGGTNNGGTVFRITPSGTETVLHSFSINDEPLTALTQGNDGNFYGTTSGGANHLGTAFKITSAGVYTMLHTFGVTSGDGSIPSALTLGNDGNFYGTTTSGGNGLGTVFKITPAGTETVVYSFAASPDPYNPSALIQGSDGNLYGTSGNGGANSRGTIFAVTLAGAESVVYSFGVTSIDGLNPVAPLIQGSDGHFYGTTPYGGTNTSFNSGLGGGTFFRY